MYNSTCSKCGGVGLIHVQTHEGNAYRSCECIRMKKYIKALEATGIPKRYLAATVNKIHPDVYAKLPEFYKNGIENNIFTGCKKPENAFCFSSNNPELVGKSSLLAIYLMNLLKKAAMVEVIDNVSTVWINWENTYEWYQQNAINSVELNKRTTRYSKADILVIDDLGGERIGKSDSFGLAQLSNIINTRYDNNNVIHLTTRLNREDLIERYGQKTIDRLFANSKLLDFDK